MKITFVVFLCVVCCLAGCAEAPWRTNIGSVRALMTPADARIITERARPSYKSAIVCAEPSPDIAKALSVLAKVSGGNGAVNAAGGISTSQSISILAGRTAGVVALRDGLFKACEAYANGAITSRSYSLILSNYGDILVTLLLAEDAAGISSPLSNPAPKVAQDFTIESGGQATVNGATGGTDGRKTSGSKTTPPAAGPGTRSDNSSEVGGSAAAAGAFANDAAAGDSPTDPTGVAAKSLDAKATPAPSVSEASPNSASADDAPSDQSNSKWIAARSLAGPQAVVDIARLFLMESSGHRGMGSLITLCMSGTSPANPNEKDSPAYTSFCENKFADILAGALKAQNDATEAKAQLDQSTAEKLDEETAEEKKEAAIPPAGVHSPAAPAGGRRVTKKAVTKRVALKGTPTK